MNLNKKKIKEKAEAITDILNDDMTIGDCMSTIAIVASRIVDAVSDTKKRRQEALNDIITLIHVCCDEPDDKQQVDA